MIKVREELATWWRMEPVCVAGIVSTRVEYFERLVRDCGLSPLHASSVAAASYTRWQPSRFLIGSVKQRGARKPVTLVVAVDRVTDRAATFTFRIEELRA